MASAGSLLLVQEAMARATRVCIYDPLGMGLSGWSKTWRNGEPENHICVQRTQRTDPLGTPWGPHGSRVLPTAFGPSGLRAFGPSGLRLEPRSRHAGAPFELQIGCLGHAFGAEQRAQALWPASVHQLAACGGRTPWGHGELINVVSISEVLNGFDIFDQ